MNILPVQSLWPGLFALYDVDTSRLVVWQRSDVCLSDKGKLNSSGCVGVCWLPPTTRPASLCLLGKIHQLIERAFQLKSSHLEPYTRIKLWSCIFFSISKAHQFFRLVLAGSLDSSRYWIERLVHPQYKLMTYLEWWRLIRWHSGAAPWCPGRSEVCDKISELCWNTWLRTAGDTLLSSAELSWYPGHAACHLGASHITLSLSNHNDVTVLHWLHWCTTVYCVLCTVLVHSSWWLSLDWRLDPPPPSPARPGTAWSVRTYGRTDAVFCQSQQPHSSLLTLNYSIYISYPRTQQYNIQAFKSQSMFYCSIPRRK